MDKKDFAKFYNENLDKIYRFVFFHVGGQRELAEDLTSEIFIRILKNFEKYDPTKSQSAWFFTIAQNHLANYWRDNQTSQSLPENEEELLDKVWCDLAVSHYEKSSLNHEVYDLLVKLGSDERQIVTFHYLYGYSYAEIAQMRGTREEAVKVMAHRAIKKLRNLI